MITMKIRGVNYKLKEEFHNALKGSPGYISSEIILGDGNSKDECLLIIGEPNDNNVEVIVNSFVRTKS